MNRDLSLQIWQVAELSRTKVVPSVSNGIVVKINPVVRALMNEEGRAKAEKHIGLVFPLDLLLANRECTMSM